MLCPRCKEEYSGYPAVSRVGLGYICSRCGYMEAFEALGMGEERVMNIVDNIMAQEEAFRIATENHDNEAIERIIRGE